MADYSGATGRPISAIIRETMSESHPMKAQSRIAAAGKSRPGG